MTLREFVQVLRRRILLIVLATVVVVGAATAVTLTTTPTYTSVAQAYLAGPAVQLTTQGGRSTGTTQGSANQTGLEASSVQVVDGQPLASLLAVLDSPQVQNPLRSRVGIGASYPFTVAAEVGQNASVLTVTATAKDPKVAADLANGAMPELASQAPQFAALTGISGRDLKSVTVSPAIPAAAPTSPNLKQNLLIALVVGLLLGVALAMIRHAYDTRIRDEKDLSALSDAPLLADLPDEKGIENGLGTVETAHRPFAEAIRRLRTSLLFVDVTRGAHAFVVTSAMPGDGKTTVAVTLSQAVAQAGSRTLLVDADLRRPRVADALSLEGAVGLTTVLLGDADPSDVIQRYGDSNLYVLTAGQVPPNPSELLGSEPMERLFEKLRADFDLIIVDSPPVVPVVDAIVVSKFTSGLVVVASAGRSRKRDVATALNFMSINEVSLAGFVLNQVSQKGRSAKSYGYYGVESKPDTAGASTGEPELTGDATHRRRRSGAVKARH